MSEAMLLKEPDAMGVWAEEGGLVWLPRSLYPKRYDAIKWATAEWGLHFLDVRCLSRWMVYAPDGFEDLWQEREPTAAGAFRVWRLETS